MTLSIDTEISEPSSLYPQERWGFLPKLITPSSTFQELGRLTLTKENLKLVAGITLLSAAEIANYFASPFLFGKLSDSLHSQTKTTSIAGHAFSKTTLLTSLIATYLLSPCISMASHSLSQRFQTNLLVASLEKSVIHFLERPLEFHAQTSISDMFLLVEKTFSVRDLGALLVTQLFPTLIEIALFTGLLTSQFGSLIGTSMLTALVLHLLYNLKATTQAITLKEEGSKIWNKTFQEIGNTLFQYRIMRDCNQEKKTLQRLKEHLGQLATFEKESSVRSPLLELGSTIISYLPLFGSAYLLAQNTQHSKEIALLSSFSQLRGFSSRLLQFSRTASQFATVYPDLDYVFSKLSMPSEVLDTHPDCPLVLERGPEIHFDHVQFGYPTREETLFDDLTFTVAPGSKTALVSRSGAGKSSIFQLLYRYYPQNQGSIRIDGQDITEVSLHSLQEQITFLGQEAIVLDGTIRENLLYASHEPVSDETLHTLAKEIGFDTFFDEFEKGLDTEIGEGGKALSGGQKQKIALLRGLLKPAPICLLDEATASLDNLSASKVLDYLLHSKRDVTTLMITHKLTEAKRAETILFLEEGKIIASGSHAELLRDCTPYRELYDAQSKST